ncbi:Guanine nucleotide binding protein (G protein) [Mactra antiquata]
MSRSTPDPIYVLRGTDSPVAYLKFIDIDNLLSGSYNGTIYIWCMDSKRIKYKISAHPDTSVLYCECIDKSCVITQGRSGVIKKWMITESEWKETGTLQCLEMGFCRCCIINNRTLAAPSSITSEVIVYDLDTLKVISQLSPDSSNGKLGMCMNIKNGDGNIDERRILIGYEDGSIALWDLRNKKIVDKLKVHHDSVMCLDYSPDINKGFSGSVNEEIKSWTICENKLSELSSVQTTNDGFNDVIIRSDGKILATAGWDGNIRVFGTKRLKPLAVLDYHKESVQCLTFSEDNILACGSKDTLISLWNIYN